MVLDDEIIKMMMMIYYKDDDDTIFLSGWYSCMITIRKAHETMSPCVALC